MMLHDSYHEIFNGETTLYDADYLAGWQTAQMGTVARNSGNSELKYRHHTDDDLRYFGSHYITPLSVMLRFEVLKTDRRDDVLWFCFNIHGRQMKWYRAEQCTPVLAKIERAA